MSQHDFVISDANGAVVLADINDGFQALASLSSGASAPATTYANQLWVDTTNHVIKRRNEANNAWIIVGRTDAEGVLAKTALYTLQLRDFGKLIDATSGTWTLTLPAAATATDGFEFSIRNTGSGTITIDPDSSETIDGATTLALPPGSSCIVYCNGTLWRTVGLNTAQSAAHGQALTNGKLVFSVGANALTIAIKTLAGADPSAADPVKVAIPDGAGGVNVRSLTAATSLVISSGSTLGATSNVAFRVWVVAFDDGGTVRLGAINCATATGIEGLEEGGSASSTAEGGAGGADTAGIFYTGSAVTSKRYRVLGFASWESGLATAGTWAAGASVALLFSPGMPLPGQRVQGRRATSTAAFTANVAITRDDSIPQNTEGVEFLTVAITPRSKANRLRVSFGLHGINRGTGGSNLAAALFRDSVADALAAFAHTTEGGNQASPSLVGMHERQADGTSAITFKLRLGGSDTNPWYVNQRSSNAGERIFGGVSESSLEAEEFMG